MGNQRDPSRDKRTPEHAPTYEEPAAPDLAERILERAPDGGPAGGADALGPSLIERAGLRWEKRNPPAAAPDAHGARPKARQKK